MFNLLIFLSWLSWLYALCSIVFTPLTSYLIRIFILSRWKEWAQQSLLYFARFCDENCSSTSFLSFGSFWYHSVLFSCYSWFLLVHENIKIPFNPVLTISSGHSSLLIPFDISMNFLSQFTNHIQSQTDNFSFLFSIVFSFLLLIRMHVLFLIFHMYLILVSIFQFQFLLSSTSMLLLIGKTKTSCFSTFVLHHISFVEGMEAEQWWQNTQGLQRKQCDQFWSNYWQKEWTSLRRQYHAKGDRRHSHGC